MTLHLIVPKPHRSLRGLQELTFVKGLRQPLDQSALGNKITPGNTTSIQSPLSFSQELEKSLGVGILGH